MTALRNDQCVPTRMCVGCRARRPQREMIRCALGPAGPVLSRTAPGRGAWVCSIDCFDNAVRRRAFHRAWRREVPGSAVTALRIPLEAVITNMRDLQAAGNPGMPTPQQADKEG